MKLTYDRAGRSDGVAYVTYEDAQDAKRAIREYDGANAKGMLRPGSVYNSKDSQVNLFAWFLSRLVLLLAEMVLEVAEIHLTQPLPLLDHWPTELLLLQAHDPAPIPLFVTQMSVDELLAMSTDMYQVRTAARVVQCRVDVRVADRVKEVREEEAEARDEADAVVKGSEGITDQRKPRSNWMQRWRTIGVEVLRRMALALGMELPLEEQMTST